MSTMDATGGNVRDLGSGRRLQLRFAAVTGASALFNTAVISLFLGRILVWDEPTWRLFLFAVAGWTVILTVVSQRMQRSVRALARWLDRHAAGAAGEADHRVAFAAATDVTREVIVNSFLLWPVGAALVGLTLLLLDPAVSGFDVLALGVAGALGGAVSVPAVAFLFKRETEALRRHLARLLEDPDERAAAVRRLPIGWKLQGTVLVTTVVPVVAMLTLVHQQSQGSLVRFVQERQLEWLERAGPGAPAAGDLPVSAGAGAWLLLDAASGERVAAAGAAPAAEATLPIGAEPGGAGQSAGHVFAWRRVDDGRRILVATLAQESLASPAAGSLPAFLALFALALGVACSAAWVVARDLGIGVQALRGEVDRIAGGDLSRPQVYESEDELGDLARAFDGMRRALRETVGRVGQAADRVETAAAELGAVGAAVAAAAGDQERAVTQARESTDTVREQAAGITTSAQELSASVEESSSSILEMGAAGEELNQTASLLSGRVDEVSTSIEQMIRSVTEMARHVEGLSEAAIETQSSVEEMAGSMREVDANAAETARLSAQVVQVAEGGREKVQETISGMEAIRDATDTVEQVIRGLGGRAKEIGAIVDVIDDVADETNLLALNAAIIAAQAGEHGRAFSVVADEIKELADRVMASTKEIGGLIRAVQEESSAAISAIEQGSESVWVGVERSAQAGESLEAITRTSRESGQRIAEIVQAVQEQAKAAHHVQALMDRVRVSVEQLRAATREQEQGNEVVLRGSTTMRDVAQQVHRTTEEQARGGNQIRGGIEVVRQAVERIYQALQDQAAACQQSAAFMGRVSEGARANHEAAARAERSTGELHDAAETLRQEIARFRL
jgi:methyl-accepting chemotaxis protein